MIKLEDKPGVQAPDATWPFGKSLDRAPGVDGLPLNSASLEDYHQFFAKLFDASGLTSNDLPDNETNGFQMFEALLKFGRNYDVFNATISQASTAAPTDNVQGVNDIGAIVWSRVGSGIYEGTLVGMFPDLTKVQAFIGSNANAFYNIFAWDNDTIRITTANSSGTNSDDLLSGTSIEIRVHR